MFGKVHTRGDYPFDERILSKTNRWKYINCRLQSDDILCSSDGRA